MDRAYSLLHVKSVDTSRRVFTGVATTPEPDRMGDVIEPAGVAFTNPLPLLLYHDAQRPVGTVTFSAATRSGIAFEATLPSIAEPGTLQTRVDEAWHSITAGLITGVSIGFRVLDRAVEKVKSGDGLRFLKTEVLELSLVAIPANAGATIQHIKAFDRARVASDARAQAPASGVTDLPVVSAQKGARTMKTIAEQTATFEATRMAKSARMSDLMTTAGEAGLTLDAAQTEEYDTLDGELKSLDAHLSRLAALEANNKAAARPAVGDSMAGASNSRGAVATVRDTLPPGIEFARYAMCLAAAKGSTPQALEIAKSRYPDQVRIASVLKAAVNAGTTTDPTWAGALVPYQEFTGDFIEFLRPATIIGKFGLNGIPSLRRVPFNVRLVGQTSGGAGYWVGQGKPKPLTKMDFAPTTLRWAKVANIAVLTDELVRFSSPSAETLVRDALAGAIIERIDRDFVDPDKAEVVDVSPASITHGVVAIPASGTDAAHVRADIATAFGAFIAANLTPANGVWIMTSTTALALSLMRNPLGQPEFPGITMNGGTFEGMPVITSQYVAGLGSPASNLVILVNASDVYLSDDGQVVIDASREASLEMDSAPTNASHAGGSPGAPVATSLVSMFQTNSIALRAERFINWKVRRAAAVAYIDGVAWA